MYATLRIGTVVGSGEDVYENAEFSFETAMGVAGVKVYQTLKGGEKKLRAYYPIRQVRYIKVED